jgi:hypothetical protein
MLLVFALAVAMPSVADEFELTDGTILKGKPASMNEFGLVVRQDVGGFSDRVPWGRLTDDTLRKLVALPAAKEFVEPFLEQLPGEKPKPKPKEIAVKAVPRVERPEGRVSWGAAFSTPAGFVIFGVLMIANLYAAYAVALFRNRPVPLVCGLSAILPVVGPAIFLALPPQPWSDSTESEAEPSGAAATDGVNPLAPAGSVPASGLSLSAHEGGVSTTQAQPATYNRGDTTFNRRFFETKLGGFFRVVPTDAEKDLVLSIKTTRADVVAKRISRISSNEMHVQTLKTGAPEVQVAFGDIVQVQVRHKDAKA